MSTPVAFTDTPLGKVLADIVQERGLEMAKGYTTKHDDEFGHGHLVNEALVRLEDGGFTSRKTIIQAATLLVAAAEAIDRQVEQ